MKRSAIGLLLAGGLSLTTGLQWTAIAQTEAETVIYQTAGENIPLEVRRDIVAVKFKKTRTRGIEPVARLQKDLSAGFRSGAVSTEPIFQDYALISFPQRTRGQASNVRRRLETLDYVEETVPVLSQPGSDEPILMPNEIIVKIEGEAAQVDRVLQQNNLTLIEPLKFTENRYVVRTQRTQGLEVISEPLRLNNAPGIEAASLNLIQDRLDPVQVTEPSAEASTRATRAKSQKKSSVRNDQWHFDSRPRRGENAPRTDVMAPEALKKSKDGKGVVVAVLDTLIQWDHPDLIKNLHDTSDIENAEPNEKYGWDIVEDDADTRLGSNSRETRHFRESFQLGNAELLKMYKYDGRYFDCFWEHTKQPEAHADCIRTEIRNGVAGLFHGTNVAGVIATKSKKKGIGIAPKAKILPVRVLGHRGGSDADIISGIYYAASREADIINMSLGGPIPNSALRDAINDVLTDNPGLVIVTSAGNAGHKQPYKQGASTVSYPAKYPEILSVGATSISGGPAYYSSWGSEVDVTAPGGELGKRTGRKWVKTYEDGILTTGGIFGEQFWDGIDTTELKRWGRQHDPRGRYYFTQGTSFSAPVVSGVLALMKSQDRKRKLSREQLIDILQRTASYQPLNAFSPSKQKAYYGSGLVNAQKAVQAVKDAL